MEQRKAPKGQKITDGGVSPPYTNPPKRKPCKGERSFVPSALLMFGPGITGANTPACSLFSLSGLGMDEQLFSALIYTPQTTMCSSSITNVPLLHGRTEFYP